MSLPQKPTAPRLAQLPHVPTWDVFDFLFKSDPNRAHEYFLRHHKTLSSIARAATPAHVPSWSAFHALSLMNPKAAREYFLKHEKVLSPVF